MLSASVGIEARVVFRLKVQRTHSELGTPVAIFAFS
jgi:hypothetical protein